MSQSAGQHVKIGRSYTRARRFPWVIGKIQGWTIPLGPYTATQLGVLIGGLYLLVQTFGLWSRLGAAGLIVITMPFAATWAVRHAAIEGRTPLRALAGLAALGAEPRCGRIDGRLARDARPSWIKGSVRLSALPAVQPVVAADSDLVVQTAPKAAPMVPDTTVTPETAVPSASEARLAGRHPVKFSPARQIAPTRAARPHPHHAVKPTGQGANSGAARPAPTALQTLLAAPADQNESS
ncbi:hypothetical protein [Actinomadura sp. 6N118]|uniref:hypothetical protein n=1 Tax=Actinomadura sp. 6N118 TaxID=3375151 RepID=UPI0037ACF56B